MFEAGFVLVPLLPPIVRATITAMMTAMTTPPPMMSFFLLSILFPVLLSGLVRTLTMSRLCKPRLSDDLNLGEHTSDCSGGP